MKDKIWIVLSKSDKLKTIRFQGKPESNVPLKNSNNEKTIETLNKEEKLNFTVKKDKIKKIKP